MTMIIVFLTIMFLVGLYSYESIASFINKKWGKTNE